MPQTGAAGFRRSDRRGDTPPAPIAEFDPVGEIDAYDTRRSGVDARPRRPRVDAASRWSGEESPESRAAALGALADAFAAQFGVDEEGPSAAALADRFGFRFEETASGPAARRTVTITGHGAARSVPPAERAVGRSSESRRRRVARPAPAFGLHADRAALWAVGLALVLALVAGMSAHGLPLH
ncbi:MAG TPA: hypothetical protein VFN65_15810 [Solirubrobacteraceae bacterium]|nr:hypothetical protein [Solirubrobacteraceae bacterium]